ncbi:MAG: tripartite tricarboxylate transporter substrate binding protein [Polynucleobacter sp.]|jgi:tripartite-type tricarboxylate transporter receptor subunit TctC|nr:tripartite tricarboxylate transporter substrate binding protein [Polynucleobacter sp.]
MNLISKLRLLLGILLAVFIQNIAAQNYPNKPIKLIVPFPAGGATDVVARALSTKLSPLWKQQLIVENKPGAGGNIGADIVAKSSPDGYTLLLSSPAEVAINPSLYKQMPFDASKDLVAISKVASAPLVLVVNSQSPIKSLADLVQLIQAKKGAVNFASSGSGGPQHLAGELFKSMANVSMTHIPYKGGAPAITDLLGGQVDLFFAGIPPALPHINSGKLRAIAVTTLKRSPLLPNIPTIAESGYPGFNIENWQGIFVPAGTSSLVIELLNKDIAAVTNEKSFYELLSNQGAVPSFMPSKEFAAFVQNEAQKYSQLVKESGAKVD